jgi:hypothetical protein
MVRFVEARIKAARTKQGRRKLRLFGSACFRIYVEHYSPDETDLTLFREVADVAERYADGMADKGDLSQTREKTSDQMALWLLSERPQEAMQTVRWCVVGSDPTWSDSTWSREPLDRRRAAQVRDLFGNPFQPAPFSAAWRTGTALALAGQMYHTRDFSAMPILADALQDAGCDNTDILAHCRGEGLHVRGCWVVDLVLGKE